ncbi:glycosyl transferase family 2 (plasmid) [Solidesulfovibrio carbinoliphilus subsp. oakridgensis]|uniref:Glycosyl transferase family 2 n=1 Tax=Solidesulfovibrio carbinoliphilus subsp. oakridgensis TaxID=694327 RepID=G7QE93_9BACT|nr:glycosyltransferase [Solidesulfovibrio carbinoliphilus]EHJ45987.1 glycosyl transferase family 2 [Solidesulfovibrio carbinoliphilus subsp. oakridgensis]
MPQSVDVTVVVPAYNAAATLPATLAGLAAQRFAGRVEVIVVDDGSTDATAAVAEAAGATVLRQKNQGPATARNAGATAGRGELLVFTDADCEPHPDFLAALTRPLADPGVSGVQGAYRTRQPQLVARFAQAEFEDRYAFTARFPCLDLVATYAAAFRRELFLQEGGFDTSYPVANNEDTEFSYRLCRLGHRLVFAPKALVFHRHPATLGKYLRIKFWRAYWRLAACRDHPEKVLRDGYTPGVVRLQTALAGLLALGLIFWPVTALGGVLALAGGVAVLCSALPFAAFAGKRDRGLAVAAPGLVLARSLAFAGGAAWAVLERLAGRACTLLRSRRGQS